jgi:cell wall-associated NlpC family hydrolase
VAQGLLIAACLVMAPLVAPGWAAPGGSSSGPTGSADTLDGVNSQIVAAHRRLEEINRTLDQAAEAFDAGRVRLGVAQTAADEAKARVGRADRTVQDASAKRRGLASSAYRTGSLDRLSVILSGDPSSALDRAGAIDALARRARSAETELRVARIDLTEAQNGAQKALAAAGTAFDALADQKRTIEESAAEQRAVLDMLVNRQADLERVAREQEAAALRSQQLAEAATAARAAEAAAAEQARLRQQADLAQQAGEAFAATPATAAPPPAAAAPPAPSPAPAAPAPPPVPVPAPAPVLPAPVGGGGATAVAEANRQLGKPYVWAAEGPDTFDCSGLTQWVWAKAGVTLTHYTGAQWNEGKRVTRDQLIPGDLVFFGATLDHVGIYIGGGKMIHAPRTGEVVRVENVWWSSFRGGARPGG